MKLPAGLSQMFEKHSEKKELFVSLLLFPDGVVGSLWQVGEKGESETRATASQTAANDSWEDRTEAADTVLATLEEKAGTTDFHKVTLGLPARYLTESGEITKEVRGHIKKITEVLELAPMGFVPIHQALIYTLKKQEGVPPSAILIGVDRQTVTVAVYKVGNLVGIAQIERGNETALQIEEALKHFQDLEVLPSRMLLYGASRELCEEVKGELLQHPWPTRANFLHFPKIERVSEEQLAAAVSLAGASELGVAIGEEEITSPVEEEANVEIVTPEELGFRREDVIEKPSAVSRQSSDKTEEEQEIATSSLDKLGAPRDDKFPRVFPIKMPKVTIPKLPPITLPRVSIPLRGGVGVLAGGIIVALGFIGFLYWKLPSAVVTIYEIPKSFSDTADVVIDPTATVVDPANHIIPAKLQETSVSGEKTMPVTGKKEVGDPAKGAVVIYNKSLTGRTFKKGSVLVANALRFTLDSDVSVASASESLASGSITFGKATGSITAEAIGVKGNLPAATEFAFKDIATGIAVARNDQALAGGTSREVTVVSRSDMDNFVKAMTKELVDKAKAGLVSGVSGSDVLIDETVTTEVAEKQFTEELDQETTELHGKLTITISGISYSKNDAAKLFEERVSGQLAQGYQLVANRTTVTLSGVQVKKDGKVSAKALASAIAMPTVEIPDIQRALAGKKLTAAQEYLRGIAGIGSAGFDFRWTLGRNRLPINPKNISVTVAIQE